MNRLQYEGSPYLLQHANNPVNWYPWGEEAFEKAKQENKPIFLSIGYSTCHWCHVMARESFEDVIISEILNRYYVSIKVDREERPDIDSIYMSACYAMTGGGGWPTSLFLTPDGKPFFAGTYFPPHKTKYSQGFSDILLLIAKKWKDNPSTLQKSANEITEFLKKPKAKGEEGEASHLAKKAANQFKRSYDSQNGGFAVAPKFPMPHNLIFLMLYGRAYGDSECLDMARKTLIQMRLGGIYDHIGGGFSRYSTDEKFLVPHFEKMLYDNGLLIIAYCVAYAVFKEDVFLRTAIDSAEYVLERMTDRHGGFYSAEDADSEGGEGAYYVFEYDEIIKVLGRERGDKFAQRFGITPGGNFEGKNILNLLTSETIDNEFDAELSRLRKYRGKRLSLHLDDKILCSWNSIMIIAMTTLYRVTGNTAYLDSAKNAVRYIEENLTDGSRIFSVIRQGRRQERGYLDDYAFFSMAHLFLFSATGNNLYLERAKKICKGAVSLFLESDGGYSINSEADSENLIMRARETFDGAIPSGNSAMALVLTRLSQITGDRELLSLWEKTKDFLLGESVEHPSSHTLFLISLIFEEYEPEKITAVCGQGDGVSDTVRALPLYADLKVLCSEDEHYRLLNDKTTYYVCKNNVCLPPTNAI